MNYLFNDYQLADFYTNSSRVVPSRRKAFRNNANRSASEPLAFPFRFQLTRLIRLVLQVNLTGSRIHVQISFLRVMRTCRPIARGNTKCIVFRSARKSCGTNIISACLFVQYNRVINDMLAVYNEASICAYNDRSLPVRPAPLSR